MSGQACGAHGPLLSLVFVPWRASPRGGGGARPRLPSSVRVPFEPEPLFHLRITIIMVHRPLSGCQRSRIKKSHLHGHLGMWPWPARAANHAPVPSALESMRPSLAAVIRRSSAVRGAASSEYYWPQAPEPMLAAPTTLDS
jgi:hypothetical protein